MTSYITRYFEFTPFKDTVHLVISGYRNDTEFKRVYHVECDVAQHFYNRLVRLGAGLVHVEFLPWNSIITLVYHSPDY